MVLMRVWWLRAFSHTTKIEQGTAFSGGEIMHYLTCLVVRLMYWKADDGEVIMPLIRHFHKVDELFWHPIHERASCNGCLTLGAITRNQKPINPSCDFCSGSKGCLLVVHTRR